MAEVTVFVDEAVRGRLPGVCAKTGVVTGARLHVVEEVGRSTRIGVLCLLLLLGPPGWAIAAVLLLVSSSGERLNVELPFSSMARAELRRARRLRSTALWSAALGVAALSMLTFTDRLGPGVVWAMIGAVGGLALVALVGEWQVREASVGVRLDASRRWVILPGVHREFAAACEAVADRQQQR